MKLDEFRGFEAYSGLRVPPGQPLFLRLNGRDFRRVSLRIGAEKPFDLRLARCLVSSARAVYDEGFNPTLVYLASDELNILFIQAFPFGGRVEKLNSVMAGLVSSAASLCIRNTFGVEVPVSFDCRVVLPKSDKLVDYLAWRQLDAQRNHLNSYAYWTLRKLGKSPWEASEILKGMKAAEMRNMLLQHGLDLERTPLWQRRGILVYREARVKVSSGIPVVRRVLVENWNLPNFSSADGRTLLRRVLAGEISRMD